MQNNNYAETINVAKSPRVMFNHINDFSNWWAKDAGEALSGQKTSFKGESTRLMTSLSSYQERDMIQSGS
jgi:hypothetical protein